jgi:transcriptional regulator with XRE-family HTH domain
MVRNLCIHLRARDNIVPVSSPLKFRSPQEALAYEAGINRSYHLSKLEKGASYARLEIIAKLAAILGVAPAELLRMPSWRGACIAS